MAENLGGISEDVSALIRAINAALPQSNTKKTVDIKVNGTRELKEAADSVKTFGAAVKTLDESGVDRVTKSVGSIMGLLSGKLKNAPVSSITTSLIEVFTKPDASAKQLLDTVLQVQSQLENVQRLSKKIDVSLLTSSQLDSLLSRQSKIDELRYEFSSDKESKKSKLRREAYQKYEDIDVYQMARNRKNVGTAKEIAARIGINPDDVTSADAEQLQTYIRTLDLLKQLTDARKEYGEIHTSADANDYLKQEQQISKVYQEALKQEAAIREKFKVKDDPLSASFKLDEQTVKQNAQQAAEAYVNWFMRTLQTQLNTALADLDTRVAQLQGNIEKRTEQSAQRVEKNTKFARGRGNGGAGGGSGSGTGRTGEGTGDGTGGTGSGGGEIGSGVQRAGQAVKQLSEGLRKYIVSEDEAIDKIHDLLEAVIELDEEMKKDNIDSDEYDKKFNEQEEKYEEILRYRANLIRQGYDSDKYDEEFGIGAWADLDKNTKDIIGGKLRREINDISTYVDSNPITVKVDTKEADEKTQAVKDKVIDLSKDIGERTKIRIFDGVSEEVFDVEKDLDALIAKLDQMALKMEKPVFHAGDLEKDSLSSDSYRPADSLQFVVERHRGDSMGTGTYFASNLGDIIEALHTKSSEGKSGGIYAADLSKYGSSLLQFSGDEEQEAFGEFLRKVTAFVMSIASEDEAFKKQLGSIKVGDTQALFNELKTWFDMFHVNIEDLQAFIDEQVAYVKGFSSTSEMSQSKSIGTNFQQKFIRNKGIDITRGVLNDSYALGNLIFDIDKEHPFDIAFGNNEDIAAYFYKKVFERILSRKAANPLNYVDDIVDQYIGNSGIPSIEEMGTELTPKLQVIGKAHANDKPESISTLNASLLQRDSTVGIDTSEAQKQIEALKQQVSELQQQLKELSTVDKPVVDVDELQAKLERAQEEIDELNHALAGTVSESSNNFLSEQLSEAEQRIHELSEEIASLKQQLTDTQTSSSSETAAVAEQEKAAGDAAAAAAENMKNQAAAVREAEENYNRLNNAVQQYIENQNKVNTGNFRIVHTDNPKDRGRISDMVNYTDIRKGRTTKASIKKILDEYITNKKELDTGYLHGLTDEESFKLSDDDLRFRASNADRILDKLSAYVYSYQNMEEAAKLFGNANSDVFDEVQRRIENAKIANEAFEASFTKSDNVRYALSKYGIDEMTARQLDQLESAMETGGFEAFAAKVKELFGVEIPSSIEEAREAINNLNAESQSLDPSQDGETSSQQREQENQSEAQSVEQLIAEYERLGSILSSLDSKYGGLMPVGGKDSDLWDETYRAQKDVADKLRESGMYYSPDQEKWVQDIINLEDKYKELSALIESGDKKAISEMFKIDESSFGDLEILKNNLKMVIDVLNATDGMSASGAKLSWWDGWLGGGRDLFNTDELTGALKTLGISDDIIEQVAQAHRDAAEAAKQHAVEEQAAADATKNVVDAAGAQKVPGKEQPSINPENTGETADMSALGDAVNSVTKAVDDKTMAFSREAQIVQESVQIELASLQQLVQQLESIRDLSQNLPKIQLSGKDGTKANPIISPELIKSIEQLKTAVGDFDPAKLTALFSSIKNLKINENVSTRMTELATGFGDLRNALDGWEGNAAKTLEMITQLVQKANALKDVIKTANEQNVKQPKAEKAPAQKKEPEKPAQKSQDEIRADQLKAYNAALKELQALENARVRTGQSVDKLGAETLSRRVQLTSQLDSIQKAWNDDAAKGVAKTKEMLAAEQQRLVNAEEIEAAESKRWNEQVKKSINFSNLQSRTTKLKAEKDLRPDAFGPRYEEIEKKAKELSLLFPLKPFDEDAAQNARDMAEELDKMITETRNAPEYKLAKDNFVSGLGRKMETWAANNGRAVAANKGAWENIQKEFKQIDTLADGQNVSKMFDEFVAGANRAGQAGETFTQGLMKRFKSLGQYLLSFASFYRVIGVFKQVYSTVKELDDALVEMRKVSDESLSSLQRYQSLSFNMADEVGTTAQQIQQSTADWLRLGESFEEAQKSAKESTILLNVSEFDNIDKATEALVSASQAYKDLDKIDIIDKLNNIGNNFSISTDQLATGLQNAAAVLMTQGNDIDEALALLTAGNAITQDISKTSAGIRTISLRISGKRLPERMVTYGHAYVC